MCDDIVSMKLSAIVPSEFLSVTDNMDFELYEHQEKAIAYIKGNKNVIVSVPTASGKTLIAYVAIYNTFLNKKKSMYIVPLRSLAMEKFSELQKLRSLGARVTISMGDYDVSPSFIKNYDVIVCTSERADSMIHKDPDILNDFGIVIFDEIHLISDETRGPRLETVISSLLYLNPDIILVGLSATVSNIKEVAEWMNAETVISDFRAVPLETGIIYKHNLIKGDKKEYLGSKDEMVLIDDNIKNGGQCIIFRNSRRSTEKYTDILMSNFNFNNEINNMDFSIEQFNEKMLDMISHGVIYHHAGLSNEQRTIIEKLFKGGFIKIIVATPTLAAGVNLPARMVIIRDITRFSDGYSKPISNIEIQQMLGRSGRPKYDKKGYGYIYATSPAMFDVSKNYLTGELEPIISKMNSNSLIRFNILSLVSSGIAKRYEDIGKFYSKTLLAAQKNISDYDLSFEAAVYFLSSNNFITENNGNLSILPFGKITSELYIDPVTALVLEQCLEKEFSEGLYLYYLSKTPDMFSFSCRQGDYEYVEEFLDHYNIADFSDESLMAAKTAIIMREWINEVPINTIAENFGVGPGDIQSRVSSADWISYSLYRLAASEKNKNEKKLMHFNFRIKEGIKEDIISLTEIPSIGRVRARRLYNSGFQSLEKISTSDPGDISKIFGFSDKLASDIISYAKKISGKYYRSDELDAYDGK